jgi:hypothetical protein
LIGTGAALALLAGGTAAYAVTSSPIDSSGVIHGCYTSTATNGSHKIVLQDVGTSCPSGTTAIKWNQKGPAGPQGIQGPPGTVAGYFDTPNSITEIALNTNWATVATMNLPAGRFLVTAKEVIVGQALTTNDPVACLLRDGAGNLIDSSSTELDYVNNDAFNLETVVMTGATTIGGSMQIQCVDGADEAFAKTPSMTAVPVTSVISAAPTDQTHVRSGAPATRAGR